MKLFEDRERSPAFPYAPGIQFSCKTSRINIPTLARKYTSLIQMISNVLCGIFFFVPYPVAIGAEYAYFLLDHTRVL